MITLLLLLLVVVVVVLVVVFLAISSSCNHVNSSSSNNDSIICISSSNTSRYMSLLVLVGVCHARARQTSGVEGCGASRRMFVILLIVVALFVYNSL